MAAFAMLDFIATKKAGLAHSAEALDGFVAALLDPAAPLPDYQVAAWLMAVCWRDLSFDETAALTLAMASYPPAFLDRLSSDALRPRARLPIR